MASTSAFEKLPNELLRKILDYLEPDPDKLISVDKRAYLSQESFKIHPAPPTLDELQGLSKFRLMCRRFAQVGAIHQYARVTTRFSRKGFERLERIAGAPHLAQHVKKFSYMVPYFYNVEGREQIRGALPQLPQHVGLLDVERIARKAADQRNIVNEEVDFRALRRAVSAFTSLQHVQILRVLDQEDRLLSDYIRHNRELSRFIELSWAPACSHSTKTLGAALLAAQSPCSRFSSPMLSPQSAISLAEHPTESIATLVERLTCLELHFDDGVDLENKMHELSGLFFTVFTAAINMQAVHLGFPNNHPLDLGLEEVFHNVRWDRLRCFGIQAWRLDASEILNLAGRHRETLRGLRLRDVVLRDGSKWKDVLPYLRREMIMLDWISLRRIGYAKHFDELEATRGVEITDEMQDELDDSDDELPSQSSSDSIDSHDQHELENQSHATLSEDEDMHHDSDNEHGPGTHDMEFPLHSLESPTSVAPRWSYLSRSGYDDAEFYDDGVFVSNIQRKMWEKWVVRKQLPEYGLK